MLVKGLKNLYESGKYQEVLDQFTQRGVQGELAALSEEEQIECIYYKCRSLSYLGKFEETFQTVTTARATYPSPKNRSYLLALLVPDFDVLHLGMGRGPLDKAQSLLTEGEDIIGALTEKERQMGTFWIAVFEQKKGFSCYLKCEFDTALEYYHKALTVFKTLDNSHEIAECLFDTAETYSLKGITQDSRNMVLDYYQRSLALYKSLGNNRGIANCLNGIGKVLFVRNELNKALDYFHQSLSFAEESGCPISIFYPLTNIGQIYTRKGELDKALASLQRSLAIIEPLGIEEFIGYVCYFFGETYYKKGELNEALDYLQRSLEKYEVPENDYNIARVLFLMVLLTLDQQEFEQTQEYLTYLQKVATRVPDEAIYVHFRRRLAEALVLKQSPRMTKKAQAQTLLTQLLTEKLLVGWYLIANVALIDLLLFEFKATGDLEVWEEAKNRVQQFYTKAQDSPMIDMSVHALLLRAKFATVEGELDQAQVNFKQARMIAKEKNLNLLVGKVDSEQKRFEAEFYKWQELIQKNASLSKRLAHSKLEEYIEEAQKIINRMSSSSQ